MWKAGKDMCVCGGLVKGVCVWRAGERHLCVHRRLERACVCGGLVRV